MAAGDGYAQGPDVEVKQLHPGPATNRAASAARVDKRNVEVLVKRPLGAPPNTFEDELVLAQRPLLARAALPRVSGPSGRRACAFRRRPRPC